MIWLLNGMCFLKAAQVFGAASSSKCPLNLWPPAVTTTPAGFFFDILLRSLDFLGSFRRARRLKLVVCVGSFDGQRSFPPPLWGRVREGGRTILAARRRESRFSKASETPHPVYRIHTSRRSLMASTPRLAAWSWSHPWSVTTGPGFP